MSLVIDKFDQGLVLPTSNNHSAAADDLQSSFIWLK